MAEIGLVGFDVFFYFCTNRNEEKAIVSWNATTCH